MEFLLRIFLLSLTFLNSNAKIFEDVVRFNGENRWVYFTKFAYNIGVGKFKVQAKLLHSENHVPDWKSYLQIQVYLDDDWDSTLQKTSCYDRSFNRRSINYVYLNSNGEYGSLEIRDLSQYSRRRVWFFVVSDCDKLAAPLGDSFFKIYLEMVNSDGSHYSAEEVGMTSYHFAIICALSLFILIILRFNKISFQLNETLDKPLLLILTALSLELLSNCFEYYHMVELGSNGIGAPIANSLALICNGLSQFMISTILLLIGSGWTIKYATFENSFEMILLIIGFGIINIVTVGISHLDDNSHHKYHDFEGFAGIVLSFLQIGIFILFVYFSVSTSKGERDQIKNFMVRFVFFGTIYLLSFPVLLLIANLIAPYVRHKFIVIGTISIQSIAMALLTHLFISKTGDYYEISFRSKTLLPGFKGE